MVTAVLVCCHSDEDGIVFHKHIVKKLKKDYVIEGMVGEGGGCEGEG